jgi:hypothetical protein
VSLVELRQASRSDAVSGGAMDRVVVRKRIDKRILISGAAAGVPSGQGVSSIGCPGVSHRAMRCPPGCWK